MFEITFADGYLCTIEAPRGAGQARAIAQDRRIKSNGGRISYLEYDHGDPRNNHVRITKVRPL